MNIDHRNPRLRRGFAFVALAAVLGLSVVGLTQCRMVDDTVTGVDVQSNSDLNGGWGHGHGSGRSSCIHRCNEQFKQCVKDETARHKAADRACRKIKHTPSRKACQKAELKKHLENLKLCVLQKLICKKNCNYREGAGSAGR
jgi:hypothetical protein